MKGAAHCHHGNPRGMLYFGQADLQNWLALNLWMLSGVCQSVVHRPSVLSLPAWDAGKQEESRAHPSPYYSYIKVPRSFEPQICILKDSWYFTHTKFKNQESLASESRGRFFLFLVVCGVCVCVYVCVYLSTVMEALKKVEGTHSKEPAGH